MKSTRAKALEKVELSPELEKLISSYPQMIDVTGTCCYQYKGFVFSKRMLAGILACHESFEARDSDIFLATFPKSGTTWLKAIMFAVTQRARFADIATHPLLSANPHSLLPFIEFDARFGNKESTEFEIGGPRRLLCTHLATVALPQSVMSSGCKIVYLCRNPKDTCVSFWSFVNKINGDTDALSLDEFVDGFCDGNITFGSYWEHVLDYWNKANENPAKFLFLKYEELLKDPKKKIRKLAEFLEFPFSEEEEAEGLPDQILKLCSLSNMRNLQINKTGCFHYIPNEAFFRKGEAGDWINFLTDDMSKKIDRFAAQKFWGTSLNFH